MVNGRVTGQRSLFYHCLFTCIYIPGILVLLKYNESLYSVGKFKFIPILTILMLAEVMKFLFALKQSEQSPLQKIDVRPNSRAKKAWSKAFKEFIKFLVAIFLVFIVYYVMIILFGAPIISRWEETSTLALTLSALTFIPPCLHLGVDTALTVLTKPHARGTGIVGEAIGLNIMTTLLGAWLGAIAIPLDWDRPWQVWPIPCSLGALVGYTLGHFINLLKSSRALRLRAKAHSPKRRI